MTLSNIEANGASLPPLAVGTAFLDAETCTRSVSTALDAGVRLIDTAARYGTEEFVAAAIKSSRIPREDLCVLTKVYWTDLAEAAFRQSTEDSLKRLGLSYVDLLLIHWPNPKIALSETIGALVAAKRAGLTRHIGVANFTNALLEEAVRLSAEPLVVNQCEYHPYIDQSELIERCRRHGLAFMSYSPLRQAGPESPLAHPVVQRIAATKGATPAQVVLRWHLQQPGIIPLPRSSSPQRVKENAALAHFSLDATEMAAISALKRPDGRKVSPPHAPVWD